MAPRVSPEVEQQVAEAWRAGTTGTTKLARQFGVHSNTIRRILERRGLGRVPRSYDRRTTAEQDSEIVRRYASGEFATRLAAEYGFKTHVSVLQRVRAAGAEVAPRGNRVTDLTDEQAKRVVDLRAQLWSQERIGKEIGVAQHRVSRWLREHDMPTWERTRHPNYKGFVTRADGYVMRNLQSDDPLHVMANRSNYVFEHRYVMAKALGRPLQRSETVHHINGDKADNRLENLQLRHGQHGAGVRLTCRSCGSHNIEAMRL